MKHSASKYIILVLVLGLTTILFANKTFRNLLKGKRGIDEVKGEMQALKYRHAELNDEQERLQNDMLYVEKNARKDLGFVGDDEIMYRFKYDEKK